jgi:hypothetical protein
VRNLVTFSKKLDKRAPKTRVEVSITFDVDGVEISEHEVFRKIQQVLLEKRFLKGSRHSGNLSWGVRTSSGMKVLGGPQSSVRVLEYFQW